MTTRISTVQHDKNNVNATINIPKIDFEKNDDQIIQFFNSNFMKSYERSFSEDSNWDTITINNSSCSNSTRTIMTNSSDKYVSNTNSNNETEYKNKHTSSTYINYFLFVSCCIGDNEE
jgi:hypothetical protein